METVWRGMFMGIKFLEYLQGAGVEAEDTGRAGRGYYRERGRCCRRRESEECNWKDRERQSTRWSNTDALVGVVREWKRDRNHGGEGVVAGAAGLGVNIWWWSNDSNAQHAQFYAAHQREYKRWALMQMHSEDTKWEPPEIKQAIYRRFLLPFIITAGNARGLYCKNINN